MTKPIERQKYEKMTGQTIFHIFFHKVLNVIARFTLSNTVRIGIYRLMGMKIGKNVFIGLDSYLDDQFPELIEIEDDTKISHRVMLITHDDHKGIVASIMIKRRAYIGAGAIILPGCIIGENSTIGAGAVVSKDIPSDSIAVGVPAKVIKKIDI